MSTEIVPRPGFETAQFDLPSLLDGRDGRNRATGRHAQIEAEDDVSAIKAWLVNFADSPRTLANYRKEVERLWLWSQRELLKPLSSLTHEDMIRYRAFLENPPASWVNTTKYPRVHPEWRPFAGPLSSASIRQAEIAINALFSWLVEVGYLAGNPLAAARRRRRQPPKRITRYLEQDLWSAVLEAIDRMPQDTPAEQAHQARARWIARLAYGTAMRISELCENTMGGFEERRGRDGRRRWFLTIVGKGEAERTLPIPGNLVEEMGRYRLAMGLSKYPKPGESTPLVLGFRGQGKGLTRSALHLIMKGIFRQAAEGLSREDGEKLGKASAHWLRHSRGSHLVDADVKLNTVRELLGHKSLTTTSLYTHGEEDAMHEEIESVRR